MEDAASFAMIARLCSIGRQNVSWYQVAVKDSDLNAYAVRDHTQQSAEGGRSGLDRAGRRKWRRRSLEIERMYGL